MFGTWMSVLQKPEETIAEEKANASIGKGIINFAIAGIIPGILVGLGVALLATIIAAIPGASAIQGLEGLGAIGLLAIVIVPIVFAIVAIIGSLIVNLILWIAAKIVGGSGGFALQYYLLSIIAAPVIIAYLLLYIVFFVLAIIPLLGAFIGMILMAIGAGYLGIISIVAYVSAMKTTHGISTSGIGLATGIAYAIVMLLLVVLVMIILLPLALLGASVPFTPSGFLGL